MDNRRRKNLIMYSIVYVLMVLASNIFISIKNCRHQMRIVLVAYLCLGEHEREKKPAYLITVSDLFEVM